MKKAGVSQDRRLFDGQYASQGVPSSGHSQTRMHAGLITARWWLRAGRIGAQAEIEANDPLRTSVINR
jgi:hypothetical protein